MLGVHADLAARRCCRNGSDIDHPEECVMKFLFTVAALGFVSATQVAAQSIAVQAPDEHFRAVVTGDSLVGPGVGINNPL
ncbi:MAG TPA: hypothetical protein VE861_10905, partial [Gemmatimonadaceae bacterium]|nr:hypothetical protein [Gemmatimonadaceae bacterium]